MVPLKGILPHSFNIIFLNHVRVEMFYHCALLRFLLLRFLIVAFNKIRHGFRMLPAARNPGRRSGRQSICAKLTRCNMQISYLLTTDITRFFRQKRIRLRRRFPSVVLEPLPNIIIWKIRQTTFALFRENTLYSDLPNNRSALRADIPAIVSHDVCRIVASVSATRRTWAGSLG